MNVLYIGNTKAVTGELFYMVNKVAECYQDHFYIDSVLSDGVLADYLTEDGAVCKQLTDKFSELQWDYILLQDRAEQIVEHTQEFRKAVITIASCIRNYDAQVVLVENWPFFIESDYYSESFGYEDMNDKLQYELYQMLRRTHALPLKIGSTLYAVRLECPEFPVYDSGGRWLSKEGAFMFASIIYMTLAEEYHYFTYRPKSVSKWNYRVVRALSSYCCFKEPGHLLSIHNNSNLVIDRRNRFDYYLKETDDNKEWIFFAEDFQGRNIHFHIPDSLSVFPCGAAFCYDKEYWEWTGKRDDENTFSYSFLEDEFGVYFCRTIPYLYHNFEKFRIDQFLFDEVFEVYDDCYEAHGFHYGKGSKGILLTAPGRYLNGGGFVAEAMAAELIRKLPRDYYLHFLPFSDIEKFGVYQKSKLKNIYASFDFRTVDLMKPCDSSFTRQICDGLPKGALTASAYNNAIIKTRKKLSLTFEFPIYVTDDDIFTVERARVTGKALADVLLEWIQSKFNFQ